MRSNSGSLRRLAPGIARYGAMSAARGASAASRRDLDNIATQGAPGFALHPSDYPG